MARHSLSEARRSVWDLRSHLLENSNLATALEEMAAPLSADAGTQKLPSNLPEHPKNFPRSPSTTFFASLKKRWSTPLNIPAPKKSLSVLNYDIQQVQLRIRDDGVGFDISTAGSASGGHFGLLDMRERAEKVGARFSISTSPGNGTEILVTITNATGTRWRIIHDPTPAI